VEPMPLNEKNVAHMYYLELKNNELANQFKIEMKKLHVECNGHYQTLSESKAGMKFKTNKKNMKNSKRLTECLIRLPIWIGIDTEIILERLLETGLVNSPRKFFNKIHYLT
jgi:dTDP-4-amino-4,6-dideoxygalactose transaminase